jgi:hypothetical protein
MDKCLIKAHGVYGERKNYTLNYFRISMRKYLEENTREIICEYKNRYIKEIAVTKLF